VAAGAEIQAKEPGWGWTPLHLAIASISMPPLLSFWKRMARA
jgi:hypothetical protein